MGWKGVGRGVELLRESAEPVRAFSESCNAILRPVSDWLFPARRWMGKQNVTMISEMKSLAGAATTAAVQSLDAG